MSPFQQARWFSLLEAVHQIEKFANRNDLKVKDRDMKPTALVKFIDELTPSMKLMIEQEKKTTCVS